MPIYEYECQECHEVIETWQSISDAPMAVCPQCSGVLKKLVSKSSFQLKGGGWFADGYASNGNHSCACAKSSSNDTTGGDKPAAQSTVKADKPAAGTESASCHCA